MNLLRSFLTAALVALMFLAVQADTTTTSAQTPMPTMPPGTTCQVAGVTVDCNDPNIVAAHPENCAFLHYHGTLNGQPDPEPDGCGHGAVSSVAPPSSGALNTVLDWFDALFQGFTGGFSPKTVYDTVKIVEEETPSLKENAENAKKYFEVYPDAPDRPRYTLETENPEKNAPVPSLYRWFWSWFE